MNFDVLEVLQPVVMLFIALDPIGTTSYYQALTARLSSEEKAGTLRMAIIVAALNLIAFAVVGDFVFKLFNITVDDFRAAAGLILLVTSVALLLEIPLGVLRGEPEKIAIVPLATPLLAGPAAISVTLIIKYTWGLHMVVASITINMIISHLVLASSDKIVKLLGKQGLVITDKFMSLLMAALAISLIKQGLTG